ncbi:MAG: glycosyltransferase [Chthoniobacterales bacterium]|nr:glycosyltransferase [Chthoniobacterales bacterium]
MNKKLITIVTPTFNEAGNVEELYQQVRGIFQNLPQYDYEHLFIDNASTDETVDRLKKIILTDPKVKLIINQRNFGHARSPLYACYQAKGDAIISLACDLQDPPSLIPVFIKKWEEGSLVVLGQKINSEESAVMFALRSIYYSVVNKLSDTELLQHVTGFGLYDRTVMDQIKSLDDPYPYGRGLIAELGYPVVRIPYTQPQRKRGISKNNFYTLYDYAMLGITSHSKVPLRLATMLGFLFSFLSIIIAFGYLIYKFLFWSSIPMGIAPIVIGLFLFSSVQLFFIGILGEYIGAIHTQVLHRPLVVEKERVNF